jgi:phosphoribosylaminoimidazole carboxylase (NCAIR synthetase)
MIFQFSGSGGGGPGFSLLSFRSPLFVSSHFFPPGSSLGIVGGGQLGRMLAREARRKGYRVVVFTDEYPPSPAGQLATREINAAYYDPEALSTFVQDVDVVTMEFENIPESPSAGNNPESRTRKNIPARARLALRRLPRGR